MIPSALQRFLVRPDISRAKLFVRNTTFCRRAPRFGPCNNEQEWAHQACQLTTINSLSAIVDWSLSSRDHKEIVKAMLHAHMLVKPLHVSLVY